jgi:hypothetical protein
VIDALLLVAAGMCLWASIEAVGRAFGPRRERCYFCWRRSWGHASVSTTSPDTGATWTVTRCHCPRHGEDALDLAAGTSARLAATRGKKISGGGP